MKVRKLLLLGILGTLALNIAGCGGVTVNVSPDGAQIEFDDGEKTASNEERDAEESERDFSEDEEESERNSSKDEDKEERKIDSSSEDEDDMKDETDTKKTIQTDSATDEEIMEMIEALPTGIDWEDEDEDSDLDDSNKEEAAYAENSSDTDRSYDENANDAVGAAALGDRLVIDTNTGEEMYVDEITYNGSSLTMDGHAYVDLDHDFELEAVVSMTTGVDGCYEVLDYIDGTVYAHQLDYRSISQLFDEGYCLGSSGASSWDVYYLAFTKTSHYFENVAGCQDGEYYLFGEVATEEEYDNFANDLTIVDMY